ncbi:MAG: amino acid ABC transporter substrate-binding protein [Lachnospiraceae bacterium]|jgi:ABC-type amino acid transport substrate-binding protein|nr:amino acid ABC transporter substrate-binding protein [Lachnospiraceae bacterium]
MKKLLSALLAVTMLSMLFAGCGGGKDSSDGAAAADQLSTILENGKMVAAIEAGNEPWAYADTDTGEYTGFSIDLISGFAEAIGVEIEFMPLEFSEMIPAVQAGKADIVASNISRTTARAATVLFTDAIGYDNCVAVVRSDSGLTSTTELDVPEITITAPAGNIYEEMAYEKFPNATVSALASTSDAIAALKAGRADAYLTDTIQAYKLLDTDDTLTILPETLDSDTVAYALDLDVNSYTLRDAFNTYLKVIKLNGTYNELYNKYFGVDWVPLMGEYGA